MNALELARSKADYAEFIASKRINSQASGFTVSLDEIHPMLFPFQRDIVKWALRRGKAALFAGTGLGKSIMQVEWARFIAEHTNGSVLILAPLAVSTQTVREATNIGQTVHLCRSQDDVRDGINITNYERLHLFDPAQFTGIVLDECFPADTLIDVVADSGDLHRRSIADMKIGDKIINAGGIDYVQETHKRKIERAVCIEASGNIISSENHPFFTLHGWRSAKDLCPGDYIMGTETAMRLVREGILPQVYSTEISKILREILFSEMENETTRNSGESAFSRSGDETRRKEERLVEKWLAIGLEGIRENSYIEPHEERGNTEESFFDVTGDEPQTFRAWGKWSHDERAALSKVHNIRELDSGMCYITGGTKAGISDVLQSGLGKSRHDDSNRNRREFALFAEDVGQKERRYVGFSRVESVEVIKSSNSRLDDCRDENGDVYFYDIKATRHPSFSVNGLLVHNSSILKSFDSKTRNLIIDDFRATPYKLACTATPAPNDYMELGNHAEFLNIMSRTEMLASFFVHDSGDTSKWRLKGHAQDKFWEWVASWGVLIRKPSDLGYDDGAFDLPPLMYEGHVVEASEPTDGYLFPVEAQTLQERQAARRSSVADRVQTAADIVNASDKPFLVWCGLNLESEALKRAIPDAVEVKGSDSPEHKEQAMLGFADGKYRVLISKASICGFGLNFQHCADMAFVGLSDSFEGLYQAVRRCWRFGQQNPVTVHIITSELEGAVTANIRRKEADFEKMMDAMSEHTQKITQANVRSAVNEKDGYEPRKVLLIPGWLRSGDE